MILYHELFFISLQNVEAEIIKEEPEEIKPPVEKLKRRSTMSISELTEQILRKPKRRYSSRTRASSPSSSFSSEYINPMSVQSNTSDDSSFTYRQARKRGRPSRPVESLLDINEFSHLSAEDIRYREQRNKNNEASRRSRLNRRTKEQELHDEALELEQHYSILSTQERQMLQVIAKWRDAVKQVALL